MAPRNCALCDKARAILKRPKTGQQICKDCFFHVFETEVHNTILEAQLFKRGDRVAIGASGGKGQPYTVYLSAYIDGLKLDSTVLAYVMKTLNDRYDYGLELHLLSIDEGITGYRDDSLEVASIFPLKNRPNQFETRRSRETSSSTTCHSKSWDMTNCMAGRWIGLSLKSGKRIIVRSAVYSGGRLSIEVLPCFMWITS
jgi:hypothetical protein